MFDPRRVRAGSKGASAQAEHVTGTHLYAYLQDGSARLPAELVHSRPGTAQFCEHMCSSGESWTRAALECSAEGGGDAGKKLC